MDFIASCRVCLKKSMQYIDLDTPFIQDADKSKNQEYGDSQSHPFTYLDCLEMCTRIAKADNYDGISGVSVPKSLCDTCGIELRITYDFLQKAKRAHEILQETLLQAKVEINDDEWTGGYENAQCDFKENCEDEDEVKRNWSNDNAINGNTDENGNVKGKLLHTQQVKEEFEMVIVGDSSSSSFDTLSMLQKQNKKQSKLEVGTITNGIAKDEVIQTSTQQNRSDDFIKTASKRESIKTDLIKTTQSDVPNKKTQTNSRKKKLLLCHACPLVYQSATAFRQHALAHEGKRERKYTCEQCGKKFFNTFALHAHVKTHDVTRLPTFQCDKCDKSFFQRGSLYLHKQYHSEKRVECGICGKRYVRQTELTVHARTHSGDLPYKCPKCDRAFAKMDRLNRHISSFHDGYRYKCNICGREYKHQSSLGEHHKEHTGMPLKCLICDKGFSKTSRIHRHLKVAHKVTNEEEMDEFIVKIATQKQYLRIKGITSLKPFLG